MSQRADSRASAAQGPFDAPWRYHVAVGASAAALMVVLVVLTGSTPEGWVDNDRLKADSWSWRISVSAADTAVALLAATLLTGPVRVLRGQPPAIHRPLRRVLGVWTAVFAAVHVLVALFIHTTGWAVWGNWLRLSPFALTGGKRGLANWLGLAQVGLLVALVWLSRDRILRRIGPRPWKALQRSTYLLAGLVAVHTLVYQAVEQRIDRHRVPVLLTLLALVTGQLAGFAVVRRRRAEHEPAR